MTALNDVAGCAVVLNSLADQSRRPDEILIVDGGSCASTLSQLRAMCEGDERVRLIEAGPCNIARGRNIGIKAARGRIIATTDCGCRLDAGWLAALMRPFDEDTKVAFVGGVYKVDARSLFEEVVGLATMPGQMSPVDEKRFKPSARSMAFTKALATQVGGFPEWLYTAEDTLFDVKLAEMGATSRLAKDAVAFWRPRSSLKAVAKQFYLYGRGGGHVQLDPSGTRYNLRNLTLLLLAISATLLSPIAWFAVLGLIGYFYIYAFSSAARRVARRTRRLTAYPICIAILVTVLLADAVGYCVGSWQRHRHPEVYRDQLERYLGRGVAISTGSGSAMLAKGSTA